MLLTIRSLLASQKSILLLPPPPKRDVEMAAPGSEKF